MEEILYVKIAQNIPVAKRQVTFHDLATLHCTNKKVVQELNQMVFYTLPAHGPQKTMFTIAKVYEVIHQKYPNLKIENLGERDFVIDYEKPDEKEKQKKWEYVRTIFVSFIVYFSLPYSSSETGSHHSLESSKPGTSTARWLNQLSGAAPCQCFTSAGILMQSPGFISTASFPSS
mgnify:CR=1 FL=1